MPDGRSPGRALVLVGLGAVLSVGACRSFSFFPAHETAHFQYYVEAGRPAPCPEIGEWLERSHGAVAAFLQLDESAARKPIKYLLHASRASARAACGGTGSACTQGSTVRADLPVLEHEVVHAIANSIGTPPHLFQEGLADMLGGSTRDRPGVRDDKRYPIEQLIVTSDFRAWVRRNGHGVYVTAASFVRFLVERFGKDAFLRFYGGVGENAGRSTVSAAFQRDFGRPLDSALAEWRARPPAYPDDNRFHVTECAAPAIPEDTEVSLPVACARSGVGTEGVFRFVTRGDPVDMDVRGGSLGVQIGRCQGGGLTYLPNRLGPDIAAPRGVRVLLDVPAGDYFAVIRTDSPRAVAINIVSSPRLFYDGRSADVGTPVTLSEDYPVLVASRWGRRVCGGSAWCPGLTWNVVPASNGVLVWSGLIDEVPRTVIQCESVGSPLSGAACSPATFPPGGHPPLAVRAGQPLHLGALYPSYEPFFATMLLLLPHQH